MNDIDEMPSLEVATVPTQESLPVVQSESQPMTPAQARVEAVAHVLHSAYQKASTLELTPEQVKALKADFPDEAFKLGAGGNPDLLYIEHAFLRDRLDEVIGMGQWALVRTKPHWAEEFVTQKGQKAVRLYADCALLIKGCLVSEAIGDMIYYPNNASQSYGDAAEGSETAAFRRCAKKIGVGLQAWKKDFCADWMAKHRSGFKSRPTQSVTQPLPTKPEPKPVPKIGTEATRAWMIEQLKAGIDGANRAIVTEYFQKSGALLPTEDIEDLPLRFVPVSKDELTRLSNCISNFEAGGDLVKAFEPHYETEAEKPIEIKSNPTPAQSQPWFNVIVPIPHKGQKRDDYLRNPDTIGSLYLSRHGEDDASNEARQRLWGFVTHYAPKGWTKKDGTTMPPSDSDMKFRDMLDAFADWFEKNHPDEKL